MSYLKSATSVFSNFKISRKIKVDKFATNIFENYIVIFKLSTLEFIYLEYFNKKQKYLTLGKNMLYFSIFDQRSLFEFLWAEFVKTIVIF